MKSDVYQFKFEKRNVRSIGKVIVCEKIVCKASNGVKLLISLEFKIF